MLNVFSNNIFCNQHATVFQLTAWQFLPLAWRSCVYMCICLCTHHQSFPVCGTDIFLIYFFIKRGHFIMDFFPQPDVNNNTFILNQYSFSAVFIYKFLVIHYYIVWVSIHFFSPSSLFISVSLCFYKTTSTLKHNRDEVLSCKMDQLRVYCCQERSEVCCCFGWWHHGGLTLVCGEINSCMYVFKHSHVRNQSLYITHTHTQRHGFVCSFAYNGSQHERSVDGCKIKQELFFWHVETVYMYM